MENKLDPEIMKTLKAAYDFRIWTTTDVNVFIQCLKVLGDGYVGKVEGAHYDIVRQFPTDILDAIQTDTYILTSHINSIRNKNERAMLDCKIIEQVFANLKQEENAKLMEQIRLEESEREETRRYG